MSDPVAPSSPDEISAMHSRLESKVKEVVDKYKELLPQNTSPRIFPSPSQSNMIVDFPDAFKKFQDELIYRYRTVASMVYTKLTKNVPTEQDICFWVSVNLIAEILLSMKGLIDLDVIAQTVKELLKDLEITMPDNINDIIFSAYRRILEDTVGEETLTVMPGGQQINALTRRPVEG